MVVYSLSKKKHHIESEALQGSGFSVRSIVEVKGRTFCCVRGWVKRFSETFSRAASSRSLLQLLQLANIVYNNSLGEKPVNCSRDIPRWLLSLGIFVVIL